MSPYYIARVERDERASWVSWWRPDGDGYTDDVAEAGVFRPALTGLDPTHNDGSGAIAVQADIVERLTDLFEIDGRRRLPNSSSVWLALVVGVIEQPRRRWPVAGEPVKPRIPGLDHMIDFMRRSIERRGRWVP